MTDPRHEEPEHYERFGFCRIGCEECDRLDREEREDGMPTAEALSHGVMMALAAADAQLTNHAHKPHVDLPKGQVWAWMNGPGTPHWEPRATGVVLP